VHAGATQGGKNSNGFRHLSQQKLWEKRYSAKSREDILKGIGVATSVHSSEGAGTEEGEVTSNLRGKLVIMRGGQKKGGAERKERQVGKGFTQELGG